jgi:hypothetical protein
MKRFSSDWFVFIDRDGNEPDELHEVIEDSRRDEEDS